jgi:hypothetical protein
MTDGSHILLPPPPDSRLMTDGSHILLPPPPDSRLMTVDC